MNQNSDEQEVTGNEPLPCLSTGLHAAVNWIVLGMAVLSALLFWPKG